MSGAERGGNMDNVSTISVRQCCGCGICTTACSGGVKLRLDKRGYYKRQVNEDKCTHCGKCIGICPCMSEPKSMPNASVVGSCTSARDARESSSGGAGYAIAKVYMEKGYTVIGAAWSKDFTRVEHIIVESASDLERLRKSKYVQSYTVDAFKRIKDLEKVVVFGTPCQIAGLRNRYGHRDGMILVDFDCMGPAGINLWDKALIYYNSIDDSEIINVRMRDKKKSWMMYGTRIEFRSGRVYWKDKFHDPFCILYHFGRMIQNTCTMECRFLNASLADVRIGDAWNYTDGFTVSQIKDGLSIITPLTALGSDVLCEISDVLYLKEVVRKTQTMPVAVGNERLTECINDPDRTIMDAVAIYNDVRVLKRIGRWISYTLSANERVYLIIKRILRKLR